MTPEQTADAIILKLEEQGLQVRRDKRGTNGAGAAVATEALEPPRPLMRELPPADSFPIDALGDVLAPAARAVQDRVQAPLAICGQAVLASATLAVQAYADVVLPIGGERTKPLSSYFVTIAETGDRKTECDFHAGWAIRKYEKNLREKYDAARLSYENDKLAWDKARDEDVKKAKGVRTATKAALDRLGPPPVPPPMAMITSTEPTFEGLSKQFGTHLPSLGIFSNEGGQFIGGHGMNEENKLKTAAGLSALWDGEPIRRVRSGEGCSIYAGRRLAVHLMVQPDVGAILFQDHLLLGQGLLSRVVVSAPESTAGTRTQKREKPETDATIKAFGARLLAILETPLPLAAGKSNELDPPALHMSKVAEEVWLEYVQHIELNIGRGGELEPIKGLANKLPEHAARLAGVMTLVKDIKALEIAVDEMNDGISLADHYAMEALRIFEAGRVGGELALAQRLLNWLHGNWHEAAVSCRDIYQKGPYPIRDKATAKRMVAILVDHGWLEPISGGAVIDGQRNREAWRIIKGT
jgi:hypothetical protein